MKPFYIATFLTVTAICRADAPPTSIETLAAEIVAKNPELQFYEAEIEAAKAGRRSAGSFANPELSIEAGRKRVRDPLGTLYGEGTAWSVSLAQTFEWPGRLALRKSIANRQVELAELGLTRFKAALETRARVLAYGLHASAEKAAAAREVAQRYQALREIFLGRDPAGVTPLLETRVIEAQELVLKRRATEAELAHRAALVELNQLRGAPLDSAVSITAPLVSRMRVPDVPELLAAAHERNFEFRAKRIELEQQGLEVSLARNERFPAVTVSPFYSQERSGERESVIGLGLSVPLPVNRQSRAAVDVAEARRRQGDAALQLALRDLEREVLAAANAYTTKNAEMLSWAPDSVSKFREAAETADRHYRLGAVPLPTYVELQSAYLDAVEALLDTQHEALEAALKLQQLTGLNFGPAGKESP